MNVQDLFLAEWQKLMGSDPKAPKVVVAVSGGVDSMVLLHLFLGVLPPSHIIVAHFDHRVRASSHKEALWVKRQSLKKGVSHFFLGKRIGTKISEEFLRKERHEFLKKIKQQNGAAFVALGHHANDQLETFLMRLIRGSGLSGLGAISSRKGFLVRPLLNLPKSDLIDFAKKKGIPFLEDETNLTKLFFRNQIRHEIVPQLVQLSARYGGERKVLERVVAIAHEIQELQEEDKKQARGWIDNQVTKTKLWSSFSREEWLALSRQVKKQVLLILWKQLANDTLETKEIRICDLVIQKQSSAHLSGGVQVVGSCGKVFLITQENQVAIDELRKSESFFTLICKKGKQQKLKLLLRRSKAELRLLEPGDRFQNKKMKRLCWELGIPAPERRVLPVVAKNNSKDLLWYFSVPTSFGKYVETPWSDTGASHRNSKYLQPVKRNKLI